MMQYAPHQAEIIMDVTPVMLRKPSSGTENSPPAASDGFTPHFRHELLSPEILKSITNQVSALTTQAGDKKSAIHDLQTNVTVRELSQPFVLQVSYSNPSPTIAYDTLHALWNSHHQQQWKTAVQTHKKQQEELKKQLREISQKLAEFNTELHRPTLRIHQEPRTILPGPSHGLELEIELITLKQELKNIKETTNQDLTEKEQHDKIRRTMEITARIAAIERIMKSPDYLVRGESIPNKTDGLLAQLHDACQSLENRMTENSQQFHNGSQLFIRDTPQITIFQERSNAVNTSLAASALTTIVCFSLLIKSSHTSTRQTQHA